MREMSTKSLPVAFQRSLAPEELQQLKPPAPMPSSLNQPSERPVMTESVSFLVKSLIMEHAGASFAHEGTCCHPAQALRLGIRGTPSIPLSSHRSAGFAQWVG